MIYITIIILSLLWVAYSFGKWYWDAEVFDKEMRRQNQLTAQQKVDELRANKRTRQNPHFR